MRWRIKVTARTGRHRSADVRWLHPRGLLLVAAVLLAPLGIVGALVCLPAVALAAACPNEAIRSEQGATHLPDCRAYEEVTPAYKNANGNWDNVSAVSPDGSSLLVGALAAFAGQGNEPGIEGSHYVMRRTEAGWVTVPADPPASEYSPSLDNGLTDFAGSSIDGRTTLWTDQGSTRPENSIDFYARRDNGPIADIGPALPSSAPPGVLREELGDLAIAAVGVSADASHVVFRLQGITWPFDETNLLSASYGVPDSGLYEYVGTDNATPLLVGVDNESHQISQCGTELGGGDPSTSLIGGIFSSHDAMSLDGKTVFFTARGCAPPKLGPPVNELFARIDNGEAGAHTVSISEPSTVDCSQCDTEAKALAAAEFEGASEDSAEVFFTTTQSLLNGVGGLYEYDFNAPAGEKVRLIAPGGSVIQVSQDGSRVYLVSGDVLSMAPNNAGQHAQPGADNVYVYNTQTNQATFITDGEVGTSNVTPNGRFLLFTSLSDLTPDDTSTAQQVFEYDAQGGAMTRVSIGDGGFDHDGNTGIYPASILAPSSAFLGYLGNAGPYRASSYGTYRWVSADGQYVFFQSADSLTPQAPSGVNSVYEYHDGVVSLISDGHDITTNADGTGSSNVRLIGTDASGSDVFFATTDSLTAQDNDDNTDIYDARIDGGFPAQPVPPSCVGDGCQGQLSAAPTLLSPGSEFQAGEAPGATAPVTSTSVRPKVGTRSVKCRQGMIAKRGKCIKRKAKRSSNGKGNK